MESKAQSEMKSERRAGSKQDKVKTSSIILGHFIDAGEAVVCALLFFVIACAPMLITLMVNRDYSELCDSEQYCPKNSMCMVTPDNERKCYCLGNTVMSKGQCVFKGRNQMAFPESSESQVRDASWTADDLLRLNKSQVAAMQILSFSSSSAADTPASTSLETLVTS